MCLQALGIKCLMRKARIPRKGTEGKASKETEHQIRINHQEGIGVSLLQTGESLPAQPGVNGQLQSGGLGDPRCCLDQVSTSSCPAYCGVHPYNYICCSCKCDRSNKMSFPNTECSGWNFVILIAI